MSNRTSLAGIDRRAFLQRTAGIAASAMFAAISGSVVACAGEGGEKPATGPDDSAPDDSAPDDSAPDDAALREAPSVTLNNGVVMPMLGFGTLTLDGALGAQRVAKAISLGYRLIDTAKIYGNEAAVGAGIKASRIARDKLFVTSKLWVDDSGYHPTRSAFEASLVRLGLDYLDLYLIHRPRGDVAGSWKAMEELHAEGRVRAIGVSNFEPAQVDQLMTGSTIVPAVNQIEVHAFFQQAEAWEAMRQRGVQTEAWAPFAEGRNRLFIDPTLSSIGAKYGKTNAQVSLRWLYQRGIIAIPRSSQAAHMRENANIFDFELDASDMGVISGMDLRRSQFPEWT